MSSKRMKLSKMSWDVQCFDAGLSITKWTWWAWSGSIKIEGDVKLLTEAGCKRNFERFAKANGIKGFNYV